MSSPNAVADVETDTWVEMRGSDLQVTEGSPLSGRNVAQVRGKNGATASTKTTSKDFVLVWEEILDGGDSTPDIAKTRSNEERAEKREMFEKNLKMDGLWLTYSQQTVAPRASKLPLLRPESESRVLHFVHIHVPRDVLCEYASIMKLRMPIKKSIKVKKKRSEDYIRRMRNMFNRFFNCIDDQTLKNEQKDPKHVLMAEFSKEKQAMFNVESDEFFPESVRIMVAYFILERTSYSTADWGAFDSERVDLDSNRGDSVFERGIRRLIDDNTYVAAYPLHDGDGLAAEGEEGSRAYLLREWASVRKWCIYQPIDSISEYLGVKNGLYFAWMGYYTYMLVPAAVVGLGCFLYGVATLNSDVISRDVCGVSGNITTCPTCDNCSFDKLINWCGYAKAIYLFDNPASIFFAFFMSIWSTVYIDMWKRYSATIMHRWGMSGFDNRAELPRPEYLASLTKLEGDKKRKEEDPLMGSSVEYASFWQVRVPFTLFSFSAVLAMIAVVTITVLGVIVYEMVAVELFAKFVKFTNSSSYMSISISVSSSIVQLVCIKLLSKVYHPLAVKLTDMEYLRTQSQYDNSLALKSYLFEFVNTYVSIFYAAFLKGKFTGYPSKYNRIFGLRQLECNGSGGGCVMDVTIQVIVILVGDQTARLVWFTIMLAVDKWKERPIPKFTIYDGTTIVIDEDDRWYKDFQLRQWNAYGLVDEYLEMVIQYGLVTIFVAAFPLAPLFALINNVFELRLDAKKFLLVYRRSVPGRVQNIGAWMYIMEVVGRVAIITNAFIIAFSSSFIPQLIYHMAVKADDPEKVSFLEFSLAKFNTSDFHTTNPSLNGTICRYPEYRNPPDDPAKYKRPSIYWSILVGRLVFIVLFQNVVSLISMAIQYLIPNTPASLREQMRREAHVVNEAILDDVRKKRQRITSQRITSQM